MTKSRKERKAEESGDLARMLAEFQAKGGKVQDLPKGAAGYRVFECKITSVESLTAENGNIFNYIVTVFNFKKQTVETLAARGEFASTLEVGKNYRLHTEINDSHSTSMKATMRIRTMPELSLDQTSNPSDPSRAP